MKISMTGIPVDDPIKAYKFYTEVLGFQELMYMPDHQLANVVSPEAPDGTALLLEPRGDDFAKTFQEKVHSAGLPIIIFGVDDIQSEYDRMKAAGVEFKSEPKTTEWGTQAIFNDTCGNWVQLHQETKE